MENIFYNMDGSVLNVVEFVNTYSPGYFLCNEKIKGIKYPQSSCYVENVIMTILENHFECHADVAKAIAWKVGKIRQAESEDAQTFIYASDWELCESDNPERFGKKIDLKTLSQYILANKNQLEDNAVKNPQECLRLLRNCGTKGIGTVYLITLLFFLSHGKYPIYDCFAMAALKAYKSGLSIDKVQSVSVNDLPGKWDKGFADIVENEYKKYIEMLDSTKFNYKKDRRLDRALWIYGHLFLKRSDHINED